MKFLEQNYIRKFEELIRIEMYKLTLSINEDVASRAKEYAKASGRSLSSLIESYLLELVNHPESSVKNGMSQYLGIAKLPKDFDEKKAAREYFQNKHA
jgi:hypothetical protein